MEESLSTRRDSVRAPDLLCVSRFRELPLELFDLELLLELALFDFEVELLRPPERLLLLDRDCATTSEVLLDRPCSSCWAYPAREIQTR